MKAARQVSVASRPTAPPDIRRTVPGEEQETPRIISSESTAKDVAQPRASSYAGKPIRRFYLSKRENHNSSAPRAAFQRKLKQDVATFVEKSRDEGRQALEDTQDQVEDGLVQKLMLLEQTDAMEVDTDVVGEASRGEEYSMKAASLGPGSTPSRMQGQETSFAKRAEGETETEILADELHQFALQQERATTSDQNISILSPTKPRFKPRVPAQRYKDRHPGSQSLTLASEAQDLSPDASNTDGGEYVFETYVRFQDDPLTSIDFESTDMIHDKIGLLVIGEEEQPLWQTYVDSDASDEEYNSDDEDENGKLGSR